MCSPENILPSIDGIIGIIIYLGIKYISCLYLCIIGIIICLGINIVTCLKALFYASEVTKNREDFTKLISITSLIWIHDVEGEP